MYKLLIVEDEPIEREAVKIMLSSNCSVLSEIEDAENGFIAIEKCKTFKPDIVMLDINMPGINGLDTIKELQKQNSNIKFLLLSSYDRFEYAQEAIKLGVEDFILKPAKIARMKRAIDDIVEKLNNAQQEKQQSTALATRMENIRPIIESDCIYTLLSNGKSENIEKIFSFLEFEVNSGFCFVVSCEVSHRFVLYKLKKTLADLGVVCIGEQIHNLLVFFVLSDKELEPRKMVEVGNFSAMLLQEMGKGKGRVGVGTICANPTQMNLSYKQAIKALKLCEGTETRFLVYEESLKKEDEAYDELSKASQVLLMAIQEGNRQKLELTASEIASDYIFCAKSLQQSKEVVYRILVLLLKGVEEALPAAFAQSSSLNISMQNIMSIAESKALSHYFKMSLNNIAWFAEQQKAGGTSAIISRAVGYIESSFNKNISLEGVAVKLGISPFYLSKIIKKQMGKSFTDLVTEKRIEKAKELLKGNNSIKEITFEAGFNSQNYFAKIFKKYVGITPTEYKNNYYSEPTNVALATEETPKK